MKRLYNIFTIAILAMSLVACDKEAITNTPDTPISGEEIDFENSIQFNTGITTRGQLVMDDYLQDDFAVYGYVYRSSWQAAEAMATPNVFISDANDKTSFEAPKIVNYDADTYTYSPIVQWTGYKYSFFAYYPAINSGSRVASIFPSGVDEEGCPYVQYIIDRQDPASTVDLMTASVIDTDANSSKEVQFHFKHRLSAIDVAAVNYCEYDPTPENNDATDVLPVTIEVHQANFRMTNLLYDTYVVSLDETKPSTPSNNSTGTIANFVSRKAKKVVGIEYVPEAIEDAKVNSEINGITNTLFYAGDMKDMLTQDFINEHGRPDVIITDPPRAGMHNDVIDVILFAEPKRIVYVSCNPATQARDLQLLDVKYKVMAVQPVDMFPHTHHVENVVLLEKR